MTNGSRWLVAAAWATFALLAAGCEEKRNVAESAGQKIDRAAESAGQKMERASEQATASAKDAASKAGQVLDDAALTAKVKAALFAEPGLKTLQIDVDSKNGVVTLAGSVDSEVLHKRAVQIAGAMSGVQRVVDKLVVKA